MSIYRYSSSFLYLIIINIFLSFNIGAYGKSLKHRLNLNHLNLYHLKKKGARPSIPVYTIKYDNNLQLWLFIRQKFLNRIMKVDPFQLYFIYFSL